MEKYDLILSAEEQFAREVTLGAIVARPPSAWFYLIPGMFIIDYLRRGSAIRKYTQHFMFPRKLAVDAARAVSQGEDEASVRSHVEKDTAAWLSALNLHSEELLKAHLAFIDVLIEHYSALLNAEGDSYYILVGAAYQNRENYQSFLEEISAAENEVDRQLIERLGDNERIKDKILIEQQQIANRRNNLLETVFS
jgi:hypothetical protein